MIDKMQKFIASAIMGLFVVMIATMIMGSLVDSGVIINAWYSALDVIPFGSGIAKLCITLFGEAVGYGFTGSQYLIGLNPFTPIHFFEDVCVLILTAMLFQAGNFFAQTLLGVWGKQSGVFNVLMQVVSGMVAAILSTMAAMAVMGFLADQLAKIPDFIRWVIYVVVPGITVWGSYSIMTMVLAGGAAASLGYVLVKMVILNVVKVVLTYAGLLLTLLFLNEEAYLMALGALGGWGLIIVILILADHFMDRHYGL